MAGCLNAAVVRTMLSGALVNVGAVAAFKTICYVNNEGAATASTITRCWGCTVCTSTSASAISSGWASWLNDLDGSKGVAGYLTTSILL
jgi:hypothetical protein